MYGKCLSRVWDLMSTRWMSASTHWNYCQTVLSNPMFNLYTLYLTRFWFLLSDAVNGSWSRCGNWVSERWSDFSRATQLIRGKARFHLMSVSAAGSSPVGHGKRIRVFLCDYFVTISTSTKNIEEGLKIQDFFWAATHLTLCMLFHPPFLLPLQLLDPPQPHSSA